MLGFYEYVAVRYLEQWPNLKEYFLKFLPKQKNFKLEIENTARYTRLKTCFADPTMEAYVAFVARKILSCFCCHSKTRTLWFIFCILQCSLWSPKKIHPWCKIFFRASWWKYQNKCQCWKECQTNSYDWCGNKSKNNVCSQHNFRWRSGKIQKRAFQILLSFCLLSATKINYWCWFIEEYSILKLCKTKDKRCY